MQKAATAASTTATTTSCARPDAVLGGRMLCGQRGRAQRVKGDGLKT